MWATVLYCTVLYCTVLYCTVLYLGVYGVGQLAPLLLHGLAVVLAAVTRPAAVGAPGGRADRHLPGDIDIVDI